MSLGASIAAHEAELAAMRRELQQCERRVAQLRVELAAEAAQLRQAPEPGEPPVRPRAPASNLDYASHS